MPKEIIPFRRSQEPIIVRKKSLEGYGEKVWVATEPGTSDRDLQRIVISHQSNQYTNFTRQPTEISLESLYEASPVVKLLSKIEHEEHFRYHYGFGVGKPTLKKTKGGLEHPVTEEERKAVTEFLADVATRIAREPPKGLLKGLRMREFNGLKARLLEHFYHGKS